MQLSALRLRLAALWSLEGEGSDGDSDKEGAPLPDLATLLTDELLQQLVPEHAPSPPDSDPALAFAAYRAEILQAAAALGDKDEESCVVALLEQCAREPMFGAQLFDVERSETGEHVWLGVGAGGVLLLTPFVREPIERIAFENIVSWDVFGQRALISHGNVVEAQKLSLNVTPFQTKAIAAALKQFQI